MKKEQKALNFVITSFYLTLRTLAGIIPLRPWVYIGRILGKLLYAVASKQRKIMLVNLRIAYGDSKTEEELKVISRKVFEEFGMIALEWMTLKNLKKERLDKLVEVEGLEHLLAARKKNPSVILLGAHFGNWEYAHLYYASNINRLSFIVRAIDTPYLERERISCNTRFGMDILYKQNGLRPAIKNLKNGIDLVQFADHKVNLSEGLECKFFDKYVATISVAPALSEKYHAPVIPMFIVRRSDDPIRHKIIFLPELELDPEDGEEMVAKATQRQNYIFEEIIKKYPQQWLWFHKRWSFHYPEIYK
jgi:Kdo2-lipid IVA lauroyltransferase/acyltransferase